MSWLNPYPEKRIRNIEFISKKVGVPILLAITIGKKCQVEKKITLTKAQKQLGDKLNAQAEKLIKAKELVKAKQLLKNALQKTPGHHTLCMNLGYVCKELKLYDEAISAYRKALKSKPQELEPFSQIGMCYELAGKYSEALKVYRESLAKDINQPDIIARLKKVKNILAAKRKQK